MIIEILDNKKQFLELLLLADEQESMIDKYLERGKMYALYANEILCTICVVTDEGNGILEIKNIATNPFYQRQGYGKKLIEYISKKYSNVFDTLLVGTGDNTSTVLFYEKCGFTKSHTIKNFFIDNYTHKIYDNGTQLIDMIYLKKYLT